MSFKKNSFSLWCGLAVLVSTIAFTSKPTLAAALTHGNIIVVRLGDGVGALSAAAAPTFLDEYTPAGSFVQTIALPTSVNGFNRRLTNSGSATSEAFLNLSA